MREISLEEMNNISGGTTITSSVINAVVNVIKVIKDAGYTLGSGGRRIIEGKSCPM